MSSWLKRCVFVALLSLPSTAFAQCSVGQVVTTVPGFLTGEQLLSYDDSQLTVYTMGYVDGVLSSIFAAAPWECLQLLHRCITGRTNVQLAAILREYLKNHPDEWHEASHVISFNAIFSPCSKP